MLIYEQNSGKTVTAECLVAMRDGQVELTEMDDGRILDLTDDDMPVGSLRAYLISNVSRKYTKKINPYLHSGSRLLVFTE